MRRLTSQHWPEIMIIVSILVMLVAAFIVISVFSEGPVRPGIVIPDTGPAESFGEGRHEILAEVKAGTYRTLGSTTPEWPMCSWKLFKADRIVAGGTSTGPTSIVVEPIYEHVESRGCLIWRRQS